MATFPTLNPATRSFTPGEYPHTPFTGMSGRANRVRNSNVMLASQLRLTFVAITEAEMLSILAHYQAQQGSFLSFLLPSLVWNGVSDVADYQLAGYGWIYKDAPVVTDAMCGDFYDVELSLETVPPEGTAILGLDQQIGMSLVAGGAYTAGTLNLVMAWLLQAGAAGAAGLAAVVDWSLSAGAAAGSVVAPGARLYVFCDLQGATATGGAASLVSTWSLVAGGCAVSNGALLSLSITLSPGSATDGNPIPGLSPLLWYDFSDASTVTLSGSTITQINDKGSRSWNLTKSSTGPTQGTWSNGLKCCNWGTAGHSNYLQNRSANTSTNIGEIYIVLDANFGSTFPWYNGLITGTTDPGWFLGVAPGGTGFYFLSAWDQAYVNNSALNQFSSLLTTINDKSLIRVKKANNAAVTSNTGFQIGNDRSNGARGWGGLIGEVVVFSSPLGSSDRASLQSFLAAKWGLTLS